MATIRDMWGRAGGGIAWLADAPARRVAWGGRRSVGSWSRAGEPALAGLSAPGGDGASHFPRPRLNRAQLAPATKEVAK
jgi:hypothetical protein